MQKLEFIMGMPVIVDISGSPSDNVFRKVFDYFRYVDEKFSPYKKNSEVTKINDGRLKVEDVTGDMKLILKLSEKTKKETDGYFDVYHEGNFNPSGIVKGWAIREAADIIKRNGFDNYSINAGGDIQTAGLNNDGKRWAIGIRNPFNLVQNVKIVYLSGEGIATSGTYERGNHIYNPKNGIMDKNILSLTVIAKDIYEADRFATAAFAMGKEGINFIEKQKGLEGYMIDSEGMATCTSGFSNYENS